MNKNFKAVLTIMGGTIGVGFLAIPYSIHKLGTIVGVVVVSIVAVMTIIVDIAYSDIVVKDKGNRQIPGYVKKYLGDIPAHIVTIIMLLGSFGVLLAYGLVSGSALKNVLSLTGVQLSESFLGLIFVVSSVFIMKNGMKLISKVSSWATIGLLLAAFLIIAVSVLKIDLANISPPNFRNLSLTFGVSIFAFYSAASIPVIDELIGYKRREYRKAIVVALVLTFLFYLLFGLAVSLNLGTSVTSQLVGAFDVDGGFVALIFSVITLLAAFTSFMVISNSVKEVLCYDYKMPSRTATFLIMAVLIWLLVLGTLDFESILSSVGNISLALQSVAILVVWFKIKDRTTIVAKFIVGICGLLLVLGMFL